MIGIEFNNASQISDGAAAALARISKQNDSKDGIGQTNGVKSGGDTIDISSGGAVSALADGGQDASASTGSYSTTQMVNFSVTYPDGSTMTTSMSELDFQAALKSDDPSALGGMEIGGQTWYGKDAILSTITGGNAAGGTLQAQKTSAAGKTSSSDQSATSDAGRTTSGGITGAVVAMAVLTSTSTDETDPGGSARADAGGGGNQSDKVVEGKLASASLSLTGSGNGMSATISFVSVSTAVNNFTSTNQASADNYVSILA